MNTVEFLKISQKEFITTDEKYSIRNIVGAGWIVCSKPEGAKYYSLQIVERSFKSAFEAFAALRESVVA
jgi:hypothetical protein